MKKFFFALLLSSIHNFASDLNYTMYLESWDTDYLAAYQGLVTNTQSAIHNYDGVTLNLSFAAFTFTPAPGSPPNTSGLYGTDLGGTYGNQDAQIQDIIDFVHTNGGKVQLAYGGNSYAEPYQPNYFISKTALWPQNIPNLALQVANVILALNLDGVDFDIEDPLPPNTSAQTFAQDLTNFLIAVREQLPNKTITLTIPAQGWGVYWQLLAQNIAASQTNIVDAINFMEYDLWISPSVAGYVEQVKADLLTYTGPISESPGPNQSPGWGIPANLIQLGIMPGNDDLPHLMAVDGAKEITQFAIDQKLAGIFIWDINRDALTSLTPTPFNPSTPFAFSNAIRSTLQLPFQPQLLYTTRKPSKRFVNPQIKFSKQINPNHGITPYANQE